MQTLVAISFDVDPDGTAYAAHRYQGHYPDHADAKQALAEGRLHVGPCDVATVMTNGQFVDTVLPYLDTFDRDYWRTEGYANVTRCNQWDADAVPVTTDPGDGRAQAVAAQDRAPDDSVMGYTPGEDARPAHR